MGSGGIAPPFLTSTLDRGEWSDLSPSRFTHGERAPGAHWVRIRATPETGLDSVENRKIP
jgi:hypothetical protein